ncbi:MAG: Rpn family recombination-promoting nuclease/putative transposase [bacterium]|nr:Rpn family recombination-promoting nuclease/putative transposase [bacterium]
MTDATDKNQTLINNSRLRDNSSRLIFSDNILSSQFLRDYADMDILRHIQPEDIEDVSERYVPLYSTERESDTVKRVNISRYLNRTEEEKDRFNPLGLPLYVISLVEHKTKVEYNVVMQLLRYMVHIWEDYEKEINRLHPHISSRKDFRYPPILPIVYYEGVTKWTAPLDLADRILCGELLGRPVGKRRRDLSGHADQQDPDSGGYVRICRTFRGTGGRDT